MSANIKIPYDKFKNLSQEQLVDTLKQATLEAVDEIANLIVEVAKQLCPVDTGTLQKSIRKQIAGDLIEIIAGGAGYINPKTGKPCDYAPFANARQPFMELALESTKAELIENITRKVEASLNALSGI